MREEKVNGIRLMIYDSIDELPVSRFFKYNKYMLIDSGVGSDMNDVNSHIIKARRFIANDDKENALLELENMRQLLFLVGEEINPKYLAFTPLIAEINGVKQYDISDDNLKKILDRLGRVEKGWFDRVIESLKKKIDQEMAVYFKDLGNDSSVKEYYGILKKRILLQIQQIRTGKDKSAQLNEIDGSLLMFFKPKHFSGSESVEISHDKNFEDMCLMLSQKLGVNPKEMTVLEFYNGFDYLKKTIKEENRANKVKTKK